MWGQPNSIFSSFMKDLLGKCDICFRAGYCSRAECDAERVLEKTVIDNVVNSSELRGLVDSSMMVKLVENIVNDQKVDFKKYENLIKKQIKKAKSPRKFNIILSKMSKSLRSLSEARNKREFKTAIKNVEKTIYKVKASETIMKQIKKIASSFKSLVNQQDNNKKSINYFLSRNERGKIP